MKKNTHFLILIVLFNLNLKAQTLEVLFRDQTDLSMAYLIQEKLHDHRPFKVDSVKIVNNKFLFNYEINEEPIHGILKFKNKKGRLLFEKNLELFLTSDSILLLIDDSLRNHKVFNSITQYEFELLNDMSEYSRRYVESLDHKIFLNLKDPFIPKSVLGSKSYFQHTQKMKKYGKGEIHKVYERFAAENPNSWINLYILRKLLFEHQLDIPQAKRIYSVLDPELKDSESGKYIQKKLYRLSELDVGEMAPNFTLPDTKGQAVDLKQFRGKYVLLEFWSSTCGACRADAPHLIEDYTKFNKNGFEILGISLDDEKYNGRKNWLDAIEKDKTFIWTQVSDLKGYKSPVCDLYNIQGIPQNYLLDPEGKIIAKNLRGTFLQERLEKLFH